MKAFLLILFVAAAAAPAPRSGPAPLEDAFLDQLVGSWVATGTSHNLPVPQTVQVDWVLNHQFVRIDQRTTANRPGWTIPYEALLFIGYDRAQQRHVFYSLTVHGADAFPVAFGQRQGNEIKFEASAGQRNVELRLARREESDTWHLVWRSQLVGGPWQAVTDLVLSRSPR